jgi:hypothetical protein
MFRKRYLDRVRSLAGQIERMATPAGRELKSIEILKKDLFHQYCHRSCGHDQASHDWVPELFGLVGSAVTSTLKVMDFDIVLISKHTTLHPASKAS